MSWVDLCLLAVSMGPATLGPAAVVRNLVRLSLGVLLGLHPPVLEPNLDLSLR